MTEDSARGSRLRLLLIATAAAALTAIGIGAWALLNTPPPPIAPPPLSAAAEARLDIINRNIGFHAAKLNQAPANGGHVENLVGHWLKRGKLTADGADFDSALALLDGADTVINGDPRLPRARIDALMARHRFVEARTLAEQAVRDFPNDEMLWGQFGHAAANVGDLDTCRSAFQRSMALNSRSTIPYVGLGYCAELADDFDTAIAHLEQTEPAIYPRPLSRERFAYLHSVLGILKSKQGRLDDAKREFDYVLARDETHPMARAGLADLAVWRGDLATAETLLRGLVASESPNADYQLKLADVLEQRGEADAASAMRAEAANFMLWSVSTGYEG